MPRKLVICCGGTNNQFGPANTNVVRLVQVVEHDRRRSLLMLHAGYEKATVAPTMATMAGPRKVASCGVELQNPDFALLAQTLGAHLDK